MQHNSISKPMDIYDFLEAVRDNNNRPWFDAHRDVYDGLRARWLDNLGRLIAAMSVWEPGMSRIEPKDATYRFYRDTRFSPDKSPFKIFFSAGLSPYGKKSNLAGYYIQIDPRSEENGLYGGVWCPSSREQRIIRRDIVDNIDEWHQILSRPGMMKYWQRWAGSALKTAPQGWPKDHPYIEYLRLKDFGKYCPCDRDFFRDPDWPLMAAERFCELKPFVDFLNFTLTENQN